MLYYTATYTAGLETFRDRSFKTETKIISIKTKTKTA